MKDRFRLCHRIENWVEEAQLRTGNMKNKARPPRTLAYTWHCRVVRNAKSYNLSAMLSSWRLPVCYACADSPQFTVSSLLLKNITVAYPVGPFAQYIIQEMLSVVSSHATCGFLRSIQKQETARLKTVRFLPVKKIRAQTVKCSWRKLTRTAASLDA